MLIGSMHKIKQKWALAAVLEATVKQRNMNQPLPEGREKPPTVFRRFMAVKPGPVPGS